MTEKQYEEIRKICVKEKCYHCSEDIKKNCDLIDLNKSYNQLSKHQKNKVDAFQVQGYYLNQKQFL